MSKITCKIQEPMITHIHNRSSSIPNATLQVVGSIAINMIVKSCITHSPLIVLGSSIFTLTYSVCIEIGCSEKKKHVIKKITFIFDTIFSLLILHILNGNSIFSYLTLSFVAIRAPLMILAYIVGDEILRLINLKLIHKYKTVFEMEHQEAISALEKNISPIKDMEGLKKILQGLRQLLFVVNQQHQSITLTQERHMEEIIKNLPYLDVLSSIQAYTVTIDRCIHYCWEMSAYPEYVFSIKTASNPTKLSSTCLTLVELPQQEIKIQGKCYTLNPTFQELFIHLRTELNNSVLIKNPIFWGEILLALQCFDKISVSSHHIKILKQYVHKHQCSSQKSQK